MENYPLSAVGTLIMVTAKTNCRCRYGLQSVRTHAASPCANWGCFPVLLRVWVNGGGGGTRMGEQRILPVPTRPPSTASTCTALEGSPSGWGLCDLHRTTWEKRVVEKCVATEAAGG